MLLEFPNPKDPQDAEVAKMLVENPEKFARVAHDWAVTYAGAPRQPQLDLGKYRKSGGQEAKGDSTKYVELVVSLPSSTNPYIIGDLLES